MPVAARVISALHQLPLTAVDERFDPPRPSLNVTRVDAGAALHAVNIIPEVAVIGVDRRLLPGEDPDQAVANVQATLQQLGYYNGPINGLLDYATRVAIANYQRDHGLCATSAIDEPTLASLGMA